MAIGPRLWDDAYITLRYARMIATRHEFAFNPGEYVLGTSTPLYALVLALFSWTTRVDLPTLACALALIGHVATSALIATLGQRCGMPRSGLVAGLLYALSPLALGPTLGGMETSLFTGATLYALLPPIGKHRGSKDLCAAAAVLLRPEGVLVAIVRIFASFAADRSAGWRSIGRIAVCILPWFTFAMIYFGNPLPHSMAAKWVSAARYPSPWRASEYFLYLLLSLPFSAPIPVLGLPGRTAFGLQIATNLPFPGSLGWRHMFTVITGVCAIVWYGAGVYVLWSMQREIRWLVFFTVAYITSYCVADPHIFAWYLTPPMPVLLLSFTATGSALLTRTIRNPTPRMLLGIVLGIALLVPGVRQARRLSHVPTMTRERGYERAVTLLGPAAQDPRTVIGTLETGAVGYFSQARVVDYYGLVTENPPAHHIGEVIDATHPDYFILQHDLACWEKVFEDPQYIEAYEKIGAVDTSAGYIRSEIQIWQAVGHQPR